MISPRFMLRSLGAGIAAGLTLSASHAAAADVSSVKLSATYRIDIMDIAAGGLGRGADVFDDLSVAADLDLDAAVKWKGASAHISLLNDVGGTPDRLAGAVQGIDNIEVGTHRFKVYEAWLDQSLANGRFDVRAGLYDTNTEFDVTDSAGLFLGPTYGMGAEIAPTGPSGPSIFPSTALAVRVNLQPRTDIYLRAAAIDAQAGDPGDRGGVDTVFSRGLFVIAEAGWTGRGKVAAGAWTYTRRASGAALSGGAGPSDAQISRGAYATIDEPIAHRSDGSVSASAFLRAGVTNDGVSPFDAAGSAGVVFPHVFASRPDSLLGAGVSWASLSSAYRRTPGIDGVSSRTPAELAFEISYADKAGKFLTLQPDVQYVLRPSGDRGVRDAVVLGLRASVSF